MTKFAFVFPGQGSQAIGMLNAFADNIAVKDTFAEASELLQFDIWKLIAEGPKEELDLTTNTQPVMLVSAIACYRAWLAAGGKVPAMVAGHSLGEYSALVASNVISFKDAIQLVRLRAHAMQEAVPVGQGGMAAILGLADDVVRAVCKEAAQDQIVEAVNFNAPLQVVIAGHKHAVERACDIAKAKGAKRALLLAVSGPFHSSLLKPASDRLNHYIGELHFNSPTIPVINNVDVVVNQDVSAIKNALVRQVASPVRWVETIQKMASEGITHVIECGPGKVLAGLNKRINADLISDVLMDPPSLDKVLELLK